MTPPEPERCARCGHLRSTHSDLQDPRPSDDLWFKHPCGLTGAYDQDGTLTEGPCVCPAFVPPASEGKGK